MRRYTKVVGDKKTSYELPAINSYLPYRLGTYATPSAAHQLTRISDINRFSSRLDQIMVVGLAAVQ